MLVLSLELSHMLSVGIQLCCIIEISVTFSHVSVTTKGITFVTANQALRHTQQRQQRSCMRYYCLCKYNKRLYAAGLLEELRLLSRQDNGKDHCGCRCMQPVE